MLLSLQQQAESSQQVGICAKKENNVLSGVSCRVSNDALRVI